MMTHVVLMCLVVHMLVDQVRRAACIEMHASHCVAVAHIPLTADMVLAPSSCRTTAP